MTGEDRVLDTKVLFESPLLLYRVAKAKYANLSGVGACLAPGRWNRVGQEAIYTSTEVGVPVLERLAHCQKELIPSNLALMIIRLMGDWIRSFEGAIDHRSGVSFAVCQSIRDARERLDQGIYPFGEKSRAVAVAVPSVIVPVWNVVLYPDVSGFWDHVRLESVEPFEFDPRLFSEEAVIEGRE